MIGVGVRVDGTRRRIRSVDFDGMGGYLKWKDQVERLGFVNACIKFSLGWLFAFNVSEPTGSKGFISDAVYSFTAALEGGGFANFTADSKGYVKDALIENFHYIEPDYVRSNNE